MIQKGALGVSDHYSLTQSNITEYLSVKHFDVHTLVWVPLLHYNILSHTNSHGSVTDQPGMVI